MSLYIIGSVLFGLVLAQFFKFYILVPTSAATIILALVGPFHMEESLFGSFFAIVVLLTSLQLSYFCGLILSTSPALRFRLKRNSFSNTPASLTPMLGGQSVRRRRTRTLLRGQPNADLLGARLIQDTKRIGPAG